MMTLTEFGEKYDLSPEALSVLYYSFSMGPKNSITANGIHAEYRLGDEYQKALDELVRKELVTATPFGDHHPGRMIYRGNDAGYNLRHYLLRAVGVDDEFHLRGSPSLQLMVPNENRKD